MFQNIPVNDFNYILEDARIAKYPMIDRSDSKLLVYDKGNISKRVFKEIPNLIENDELMVFNNTKVIQARLNFKKETGADIEIFCLEPVAPADYQLMFQSKSPCRWKCIVGNFKKWKVGKLALNIENSQQNTTIFAENKGNLGDTQIIEFTWTNAEINFGEILDLTGKTPIPPYLKRESENIDKNRYQTIYSKFKGSVAAPTAGLHFTENIISSLHTKGIKTDFVTLHVGAGTFKPIKTDFINEHEMHTEHFFVSKQLISSLIKHKGKITAVGTTTVRSLESLYYIGAGLEKGIEPYNFDISQWEVYHKKYNCNTEKALQNLLNYMNEKNTDKIEASTQIMIVPGYKFRIINKLITNFHQPKSTLLLLIAAFIGNDWKRIYDYAIKNNFRFLSYGDSSLLIP